MVRFASTSPGHQVYEDTVMLFPLAARGAEAPANPAPGVQVTSNVFEIPDCEAVLCSLNITVSATADVLDLLDVLIQTYVGGQKNRLTGAWAGGTWVDVCYFSQVTGATVAGQVEVAKITGVAAQALLVVVPLAVGNIRAGVMGQRWRAQYTPTDGAGGGTHTWTFSVSVQPIK